MHRKARFTQAVCVVVMTAAWLAGRPAVAQGATIFVKVDASGANNGTSWADAFTDLQEAIAAAGGAVTEIWVAQGTYHPTSGTDRTIFFVLPNDVGIYGGFKGDEMDRDQRDPAAYPTILSADLLDNDVGGLTDPSREDNSARVLLASDCSSMTVLHGFTVTGADPGTSITWGGGLAIGGGSPRIVNCIFIRNRSRYGGGIYTNNSQATILDCDFANNGDGGGCGLFNYGGSVRVTNCLFLGNTGTSGGAISNTLGSYAVITNCLLVGNSASMRGGAMANDYSFPHVVNCTIAWNYSASQGAIHTTSGYDEIVNSIVWGNYSAGGSVQLTGVDSVRYSCIQGGWTGTGNISTNPLFIRNASPGADGQWNGIGDDYGDLRLQLTSPCIGVGATASLPPGRLIDLGGNPRVVRGLVDMGAYEAQDCNENGILDSQEPDSDADGVIDDCDNCPSIQNLDQADLDTDGAGDVCDDDIDGDEIVNVADNCPWVSNPDQADLDDDGAGDVCDDDVDGDGVPNTSDQCPHDAGKTQPGQCGCGNLDTDTDGDTVADCVDNCPALANSDQRDRDEDTHGDACDDDIDGDGTPNDEDGCPIDPSKITDVDIDGDGILDCSDICPAVPNPTQQNICRAGDNVLYVDIDAFGANDGSNWFNAYNLLEDALAAADASDGVIAEIWVAEGSYHAPQDWYQGCEECRGPGYTLVPGVSLYGGFAGTETAPDQRDPAVHVTVLSGDALENDTGGLDDPSREDNAPALITGPYQNPQNATPIHISGFTLAKSGKLDQTSNYSAVYLYGWRVRFSDCIFSGNAGWSGGALYNSSGVFTFERCTFIGNASIYGGGAIRFKENPDPIALSECSFINNTSMYGYAGAVLASGPLKAVRCIFSGNASTAPGAKDGRGGAISLGRVSTLVDCLFTGNRAVQGGAIYHSGGSGTLVNCLFAGNSAFRVGGAIYAVGGQFDAVNCTLAGNRASIVGGGVVASDVTMTLKNCILWANVAPGSVPRQQIYWVSTVPTVEHCCVQGGWAGTGNIAVPPLFDRDPSPGPDGQWGTDDDDYGDLSLQPGSACIDAGENAVVPADTPDLDGDGDITEPIPFDLAGNPRFLDDPLVVDTGLGTPPVVDMGAYEYFADCNANGLPDQDEPDQDADGVIDACDNCPAVGNADQSDADADGIGDACDACADSNLAATIVIDDLDTGVPNNPLGNGCTMSDEIAAIAAAARNHGDFVSSLAALTGDWVRQGLITDTERAQIINAAAESGIGKDKG